MCKDKFNSEKDMDTFFDNLIIHLDNLEIETNSKYPCGYVYDIRAKELLSFLLESPFKNDIDEHDFRTSISSKEIAIVRCCSKAKDLSGYIFKANKRIIQNIRCVLDILKDERPEYRNIFTSSL